MNNINPKVDKLILQVGETLKEIEATEESYNKQKATLLDKLNSYVKELGFISDTQAVRAQIIRELYWGTNLPVTIISESFKIHVNKVPIIAGNLVVNIPCEGECGNTISKAYSSRSNYANEQRNKNSKWEYRRSSLNLCPDCQSIKKEQQEKKERERRVLEQKRDKELSEMSWDAFIDTDEWRSTRNYVLETNEYECEFCHKDGCTLHIYPHKDYPHFSSDRYEKRIFFLVCYQCIPRCQDLIDLTKVDILKPELVEAIIERRRSGNY